VKKYISSHFAPQIYNFSLNHSVLRSTALRSFSEGARCPSQAPLFPTSYHQNNRVVHLQKVNKVAILDWGHGGLNPEGEYYTAPNKQFDHGDQHTFHDGGMFYEGVWNQAFTMGVARELDELGLPYILINREDYDMPLAQRVDIANWWGRKLKGNCFGFSTHANASPGHNARGFQVHTTEGPTQADPLATLLWNNVNELLGKPGLIHMRKSDWLDGDVDYEDPFYILRRTTMPFVLIEWLFFDNLADAKLLMDPHIQAMMRQALVTTIYQYSTK
jgi:N-acetylmuramoyl-L-alanine amidase